MLLLPTTTRQYDKPSAFRSIKMYGISILVFSFVNIVHSTNDGLDTEEELQDVDAESYNHAKRLVQQELKTMKIEEVHPAIRQSYPEDKSTDLQRHKSVVLLDIQNLEKKYHDVIYDESKERVEIPKSSLIDLLRYTSFTKTDGVSVDFQRLYTTLAYQSERLQSLQIEEEIQESGQF